MVTLVRQYFRMLECTRLVFATRTPIFRMVSAVLLVPPEILNESLHTIQ